MSASRTRWVVAAAVLLSTALVAGSYHFLAPRRTPAGQPPLTRLTSQTLASLRDSFNAASSGARVIALLSPT